jgi:hypothetical protein
MQARYPNALDVATQLIEKLKGKQLAVFLDYDGTTPRALPAWLHTVAPQRAPLPSWLSNHPTPAACHAVHCRPSLLSPTRRRVLPPLCFCCCPCALPPDTPEPPQSPPPIPHTPTHRG